MTTTRSKTRYSLTQAISDPTLPVGRDLLVDASTVPQWARKLAMQNTRDGSRSSWFELYQLSKSLQDPTTGCEFGCKLYARRRGAVIEYAMFHSLTYGHSHSPNKR